MKIRIKTAPFLESRMEQQSSNWKPFNMEIYVIPPARSHIYSRPPPPPTALFIKGNPRSPQHFSLLYPAEGLSTVERAPLTCPQTPAWISETWSRRWRAAAQPAGYHSPLRISPAETASERE